MQRRVTVLVCTVQMYVPNRCVKIINVIINACLTGRFKGFSKIGGKNQGGPYDLFLERNFSNAENACEIYDARRSDGCTKHILKL